MPKENEDHWAFFLRGVKPFLKPLTEDDAVIISDRQKGLIPAMAKVFPRVKHVYCCKHLADNVCSRFCKESEKLFWNIVHAESKDQFESRLQAIGKVSPNCEAYLRALDASL